MSHGSPGKRQHGLVPSSCPKADGRTGQLRLRPGKQSKSDLRVMTVRLWTRPRFRVAMLLAPASILATASLAAQTTVAIELGPAKLHVDGSSGLEREEFDDIAVGVLSGNGQALVVDRGKMRVPLLTALPNGHRVTTLGRRGSGPGELREPKSIHSVGNQFILLDRALLRLTYYEIRGTDLGLAKTSALTELPDDVCFLDSRMVAFGYDPATRKILRWMPTKTSTEQSGGLPFFEGSANFESVTNHGILLCAADYDFVIVAHLNKGVVRAYRSNGRLAWETTLQDFVPWNIKELGDGGVLTALSPPLHRAHFTTGLVRLSKQFALLQYGLVTLDESGRMAANYAAIQSSVLSLADGKVVGSQSNLPLVLSANGSSLLATGFEPVPWVEIRVFQLKSKPRQGVQ